MSGETLHRAGMTNRMILAQVGREFPATTQELLHCEYMACLFFSRFQEVIDENHVNLTVCIVYHMTDFAVSYRQWDSLVL